MENMSARNLQKIGRMTIQVDIVHVDPIIYPYIYFQKLEKVLLDQWRQTLE